MTDAEASAQTQESNDVVDPAGEAQEKKPRAKRKALLIVCLVILASLIVVYAGGAVFFSSHFYPNTRFNDEDISYLADSKFVEEVEEQVPGYKLTITGNDYIQDITSSQIDLSVDPEQLKADAFEAQNVWLWPIQLFEEHDMSDVVHASFDHEKVAAIITPSVEAYNKDATPSEDATITYDERVKLVVIKEEVYGDQINEEAFLAKVDECLTSMKATYQITDEDLILPTILADDERFSEALPAAQKLINGEIDLTLAEGAVSAGKVGKDLLVSWLTLDPDTLMPTLDQEAVSKWADQKSVELNTVGTKRTFKRPDGKTVNVSGGVYGWKVDTAGLATTLIENVTNGNFEAIDIPCEQTADVYNGPGGRDWAAFVDIDLSEQKVRYYNEKNEELFVTDCVTGDVTKDRSTPVGLYYLRAKKSPEVLTGYNADGTKDYESHVTYWMPFIRNSIGLHDASWRGKFGGSIYKGNGSHGCVNLPTDAAKWFYDNLSTNVCVIVHE